MTLWTVTDDTGQIIRASQDIEELIHRIRVGFWMSAEQKAPASTSTEPLNGAGSSATESAPRLNRPTAEQALNQGVPTTHRHSSVDTVNRLM